MGTNNIANKRSCILKEVFHSMKLIPYKKPCDQIGTDVSLPLFTTMIFLTATFIENKIVLNNIL